MFESDFQAALQAYERWEEQIARLTWDEILQRQQEACRALLRHAQGNSRLWRQRLEGIDVNAVAWEELPLTDRALISEQFSDSVSDHRLNAAMVQSHFTHSPEAYLLGQYQVFLSAGKTGQLSSFVYDRAMWQTFLVATLRRFFRTQIEVRKMPRMAFVGTNASTHTLTRTARFFPPRMGSVVGLQDGLARCVGALQRYDPEVLYGFSSAIALLAEKQRNGELNVSPKLVLVGTDSMSEAQRALVRQVWRTPPLNSYACTEGGLMAFECSHGRLHINEDLVYLETHNGQLLVTNLVNQVQPFIRYVIPDRIEISAMPCRCGLPYRTLSGIEGRLYEPLALPGDSGQTVPMHPIVIRTALDTLPGVLSSDVHWQPDVLKVSIQGIVDVSLARHQLTVALQRAGVNPHAFTVEIDLA